MKKGQFPNRAGVLATGHHDRSRGGETSKQIAIRFDDPTFIAILGRAHSQSRPVAAIVRELVTAGLKASA
jgi:hypothetical protein